MTFTHEARTPSRRSLMAGAAWAAPLVVVASAAPAYAASMCTLDNATPMLLDVSLNAPRGGNVLLLQPSATLGSADDSSSDPSDGGGDDSGSPSDGGGEDPAPGSVEISMDDPRLALFTFPVGQDVLSLQITLTYPPGSNTVPAQPMTFPDVDTTTFDLVAASLDPTSYEGWTSYPFSYTVTLLRDVVGLADFIDLWNASFGTAELLSNAAPEIRGEGYISASPVNETVLYNADGACEAVTLDGFGSAVSIQVEGGGS